jgi:hypothetical protein
MKRLLLYIIILTALFSGGIALTSALGKTAPPPAFAQWFTTPDGSPCPMPCLFGIRPGVTKWDEVDSFLKSHPLLLNFKPLDMTSASPESLQRSFVYQNTTARTPDFGLQRDRDGFVGSIYLNPIQGRPYPRVGDVWAMLGLPQCVALFKNQNTITIPRYSGLGYLETRITVMGDSPAQSRYFSFTDSAVSFSATSKIYSNATFATFFENWRGLDKQTYLKESRRVNTAGCIP